ncbi:hypothetical protein DWB61_16480 [Ancylomarina euxinus]|uniref:Uncharacterized protein n=1 Tax=Ancylomarina euxinus TaxID=2283627 RepID=A0A425XX26_9BACT|nr:hypothetical protein [Ancylomarina euxinus]MCZ4696260.1 hypothetical protein [Ancylomarina euxinus]MUP16635.1 hypothetical protein [Ancylomarina euxinus]RRG19195.1 hypothetical protein DWB61_16480 [Ancylomarina euxinus]
MTLEKIIENRINLIEKSKPIYFTQVEQQKFGIEFIYYISILFLLLGIAFALLSSMNISSFSNRWMNSGLFYACSLAFQLKVYGYGKYITLKKHKSYLKKICNQVTDYKSSLPDSVNAEFENELRSKTIIVMNVLLISLGLLGGVCYLEKFEIWVHFDLVLFLTLSIYGLLCFHKIQKIKQINLAFNAEFKNYTIKY